ncbi:MAG: molybdenum cofactor guanylyltransferase [Granulicella sp.]
MIHPHPEVSGYVLAGGRSSRMGSDKSLLQLAGKPLIQRAVETLSKVCSNVHILSSRSELAAFGPLVADLHPGCGPLGGIEAALLQTPTPWSLFLAVDMPFVPASLLQTWTQQIVSLKNARISLFTIDGKPQPTLCLVHRELAPFLQQAIERKEFKLFPTLEAMARDLAVELGAPLDEVLVVHPVENQIWFANLNTPEEFAIAKQTFLNQQNLV